MALAGPRGEQQENLGALVTAERVALVRLEMRERARAGHHLLAARANPGLSIDHQDPSMLLHLVVAELLAGIEADEDGAGLVFAQEDDWRTASLRRLDLREMPGFHGCGSLTRRR
jgi:hypothetical protein